MMRRRTFQNKMHPLLAGYEEESERQETVKGRLIPSYQNAGFCP